MAFSTNNSAFGSTPQTRVGPDLPEISTEAYGFQTIAGQAKLRLLPTPWPADNLPPPTASLLSVASKKGLLAAAGLDTVIIASTDSVRQAYDTSTGDGDIKPFTPQLTLNLGMRISQVVFSADENFLILSAQNGGGLAVYEVANLMNGATQSSFEISTNGMTLRHLIPNPTTEKAELFALVTDNGHLLMANLKSRELLSQGQNFVLKEGVSCVSWSNKGKQLVAGLGNGNCSQMIPEGDEKGALSRPPYLEGDQHVSSILWLENDLFLVAHTPSFHDGDMPPATTYSLITRHKNPPKESTFQKLVEPCFPSGLDRAIPYQTMLRLREFPPNLTDAIIIASTGSEDVGLLVRSKTQLSSDQAPDQLDAFLTVSIADDSRRAQLPMSEDLQPTSAIGAVLDLSSKDKVPRPLPKEEFDDSAGPLPALMVLNNEGILMTWWFVQADSIRQRTSFPGLAALGGYQARQTPEAQRQASPFGSVGQPAAPALGRPTFGQPSTSTFGSAFGSAASASTFGAPSPHAPASSAAPAFGNKPSPWGTASTAAPTTSAFGKPSFGSPTPPGGAIASSTASTSSVFGKPSFGSPTPPGGGAVAPAFGQAGGLARASPWGTPQTGSANASGSAFGQTGNLNMRSNAFGGSSSAAPFGSTSASTSAAPTGGFASFATTTSAFMTTKPASAPTGSVFGQPSSGPSSSSIANSSAFGQFSNSTEAPKPAFGGTSGFKLGSTFKGDGTASDDAPKPVATTGSSMFGSGFGETLNKAETELPQTKDADMDDDSEAVPEVKPQEQNSSKEPAKDPAPAETPKPTTEPKYSGLFGAQTQSSATPANAESSKVAAGWSFGKLKPDAIAPKEIHVKGKDLPTQASSPKIKTEPESSEDEGSRHLEETPLPPESTSKTTFAPGDSSASSKSSNEEPAAEPPLPPDPFPTKSKLSNVESASAEPPLPPDPFPSKTKGKTRESPPAEAPKLPDDDEDEAGDEDEEGSEEGDEEEDEEGNEEEDEDEGADDEGSGVDVAQELTSPSDPTQSPKSSPETSFTSKKSTSDDLFSKGPSKKAATKNPPLFGEVSKTSTVFGKPSVFFPPPNKSQQSPRSPSPIRQSQLSADSLRPEGSRSISAPGPSTPFGNRNAAPKRVAVPSQQTPIAGAELRKQEAQKRAEERARQAAEEEQSLSDEEDELVRRELETPVAGSRKLDPFLAHQDYVGRIEKSGLPGQIEKVFRDINSMIDTQGLNARSLTAFVKGHTEQIEDEISVDDLSHANDFALDEISKLMNLESKLSADLESHNIKNTHEYLATCRDIRKDIQSLHHKHHDMAKAVEATKEEPDAADSAHSAPLSLEQASQQYDVRKRFAHFQQLLGQAEGDLTMLRAKLAATDRLQGSSARAGLPPQKKPTVEAVTKTILKMTSMVEKKSGDIDVLEAQLRKLGLPALENGGLSRSSGSSREASPFSARKAGRRQANNQSPLSKSVRNGAKTFTVPYGNSPLRKSVNGNGNAGGVAEKSPSEGLEEEQEGLWKLKVARRKEVNGLVKGVFEKSGPRVRTLD